MQSFVVRTMVAVVALAWMIPQAARSNNDKCVIIAEITVDAVKLRATQVCIVTAHPLTCAVAAALETSAGDGLARAGTRAGCTWAVQKVGRIMKVTIKANGAKPAAQARRAELEIKKSKEFKVQPRQ